MKKTIIALMTFCSLTASANCNLEISFTAPLVLYSQKKAVRSIKKILKDKGYTFMNDVPSRKLNFLVSECQDDCPSPNRTAAIFIENDHNDGSFKNYSRHSYPLLSPFKNKIIKNMFRDFPNCSSL